MGKLDTALDFLDEDLDKAEQQWTGSEQFRSLLQREDVTCDDLLDKFDPSDDENKWCSEYGGERRSSKLITSRKRLSFLKASCKEFKEEYDDKITDCDFMRLLELPYTDSRYVIEVSKKEMEDKG